MNKNIFEIEKTILKCQSSDEIDAITKDLTHQQLRDIVKLIISRLTRLQFEANLIMK